MSNDLSILSRALSTGLISIEQYTSLLRELTEGPPTSVQSLLASRAGIPAERISLLVADTDSRHFQETILDDSAPAAEATRSFDSVSPDDATSPEEGSDVRSAEDLVALSLRREAPQRYKIVSEIGRGGLGRVLHAQDEYVGRDVALKEMIPRPSMAPDRVERFFLEAQLTGQLDHPGIVPVYALGVTPEGRPFYTMKLVQGRTLAELIKTYHETPHNDPKREEQLHELLRAFIDASNAIAFANSRGVIHRDIKPANIMIGEFGETIVLDWGMAKVFRGSDDDSDAAADPEASPQLPSDQNPSDSRHGRTVEGTVMGTLAYMSPEQARGAVAALDQQSDIYSLGATLYEILLGSVAYLGGRNEILEKVRLGRFVPLRTIDSKIPAALDAICQKAMAFLPENRYSSAKALADDIARWQSGAPVDVYREPLPQRAGRWMRRHRTLCVATTAVAVAILLIAGVASYQRGSRIAKIEAEGRELLTQGRDAFGKNRFEKAARDLRQAAGLVSTEARLGALRSEIDGWLGATKERLSAIEHQRGAEEKWNRFRDLRDDALLLAVLASDSQRREYPGQAQEIIRNALALYGARPDHAELPTVNDQFLSTEQVAEVLLGCRLLHWVYADTLAQTLPGQSEEERRKAARDAISALDLTEEKRQPSKAYLLRRAEFLARAGDEPAARTALDRAEQTSPTTAEDFFLLGDFYYRYENYSMAREAFLDTLREDPEHFWAQYYLGVCNLRLGGLREAVISFSAAASRRPKLAYIYVLRGLANGQLGDLSAAESDFDRAARLAPNLYGLYLNRGVIRMRHGLNDKAAEDFHKATEIDPTRAEALLNLAAVSRASGETEVALAKIESAIELAPHDPRGFQMRAEIEQERNQLPESHSDLEEAIRLSVPRSLLRAKLLTERGKIEKSRGDTEIAIRSYEMALAERPDYEEAMRAKGIALMQTGKDREAIEWFTRFLEQTTLLEQAFRPTSETLGHESKAKRTLATVFRDRGLALAKLGETARALSDFASAFRLAPDLALDANDVALKRFALAHARSGWAYLLHYQKLALEAFDSALRIEPGNADAYAGRGFSQALMGNYQQAATDAQRALQSAPDHPGLFFNVACIYAQAYRLVQLDASNPNREADAESYLAAAIDALRECIERSSDQRAFYLKQMKSDEAIAPVRESDDFKRLLDQTSESPNSAKTSSRESR